MKEKNSVWYQHEGLDRAHMLLCILEQAFGYYDTEATFDENENHPAVWNQECGELVSKATRALADLYQKIGEWEPEEESTDDKEKDD